MTLDNIIDFIRGTLIDDMAIKATRKNIFEINMTQGGIGDCSYKTEQKLIPFGRDYCSLKSFRK